MITSIKFEVEFEFSEDRYNLEAITPEMAKAIEQHVNHNFQYINEAVNDAYVKAIEELYPEIVMGDPEDDHTGMYVEANHQAIMGEAYAESNGVTVQSSPAATLNMTLSSSWHGVSLIVHALPHYPDFKVVSIKSPYDAGIQYKGRDFFLSDNGGEIICDNLDPDGRHREFPTTHHGMSLCAAVLVYRLIQTLNDQPIDYNLINPDNIPANL